MAIPYEYILPPLVGAGIGWLTNFVAIKLLFRPHLPLKLMGFKLQGIIPRRRKEIARSIAKTIESELLSSKDLAATLDTIDWKDEVEKTVEEVIEHRFGASTRLKGISKIPVIGLVSENLTYHVKYLISKEILSQIDKKKGELAHKFRTNINIEHMLADRIDNLDLKRFEGLLTEFIAKELRHIEWLGAVMGFFIGLFQSLIFFVFR